jgi:hypothetical protein
MRNFNMIKLTYRSQSVDTFKFGSTEISKVLSLNAQYSKILYLLPVSKHIYKKPSASRFSRFAMAGLNQPKQSNDGYLHLGP